MMNRIRKSFLYGFFLLLHLPVVVSADYDSGLKAYSNGDFQKALKEWKPLAEQGDAQAQHNLGVMYGKGKGVQKSDAEAFKWFLKAAEQGYAKAQSNLGVLYATGAGVEKNLGEALKWYTKAAEQGVTQAQYNLSVMYFKGEGIKPDFVNALFWVMLAESDYGPAVDLRKEILKNATTNQIETAKQRVKEWNSKKSLE
ncbi:MAG: sel1 repeat family protein [Candidatus Aureabacteria bacterium]|nr:sel1 repeat family protein [Candidatus Auribacterota bacterium]